MKTVNTHEAKTHFSALLKRVAAGEKIVIARSGRPVATLVPFQEETRPVAAPGSLAGEDFWIADDFDEPVDEIFEALGERTE